MSGPSKTVCLRAFNEDVGTTNQWDGPSPPPMPKRIAWPGGKIVSNKDEALASFLRRKLDQGQTLTPEQSCHMHPAHFLGHSSQRSVALERVIILPDTRCVPDHALLELMRMLEKMAHQTSSGTAAAAPDTQMRNHRNIRGNGGRWRGVARGGTTVKAQNLLQKLEHKVARASEPCGAEMDRGDLGGFTSSRFGGRRKVDLSSLKRAQGSGGPSASRKYSTMAPAPVTKKSRWVLPDGQGGFTIARGVSLSDDNRSTTNGHEYAPVLSHQLGNRKKNKRPRGGDDANSWEDEAGGGGDGVSGGFVVGGTSGSGTGTAVPAAARAAARVAAQAAIPAVYRETKFSDGVGNRGGSKGKKGKQANKQKQAKGKGQGEGSKGGKKSAAGASAGVNGSKKARDVERSLEEWMNGGLASIRR